ncbi:Acetyl esterase/lipase [Ruminococcus flavefaciens]|uniref:Acetyl esterase/lipase n=1 Tax=Ruminococcus flavefaciens TaxID=1265 RepID=A0A1H6L2I3_RUMFL|nr:alpha/beta hydrolase [Ruminococcus flavefaciens]SEH80445.1 Acetyl esterase/lipase [Ruminococcus flavefaciens]
MSLNSFIFKKMCTKSDRKRDAGLTTPPEIRRFDDIQYGKNRKWQIMDVYRPKAAKGRLPVIVSFHGGGWTYGTKETYQFYCMELAKRGFAVVNFTYRLAPKYRHPAPYHDTNAVFRWVLKNADKLGFDTDNIFAVGDSAGAMGIALYACMVTDSEYAKNYKFRIPEGLKIKGLGLNCGIYDIFKEDSVGTLKDYLPKKYPLSLLKQLNVVDNVTADFPPCFIMTSNEDFLNYQSPLLAEKLDRLGVKYVYKVYGDENNPLSHVFHCNVKSADAAAANDDECAFFKGLIK